LVNKSKTEILTPSVLFIDGLTYFDHMTCFLSFCKQYLLISNNTFDVRQFEYLQGNNVAMKNLLFKDWDAGHEGFPYPPQMGPYAVYTIDDLHEHIDFAVQKVLSNIKCII
jgi:hypothetical protein